MLLEKLAAYAHTAWSGWTKYMFEMSTENADGSVTIPKRLVDRWKRQLGTAYADLPEDEKPLDRAEARRILDIVDEDAEAVGDGGLDVRL